MSDEKISRDLLDISDMTEKIEHGGTGARTRMARFARQMLLHAFVVSPLRVLGREIYLRLPPTVTPAHFSIWVMRLVKSWSGPPCARP